jgi:hypothetical protein
MEGAVFASTHPHTELQAFEAIEPSDAFAIHHSTLPARYDPDPKVAEARPRVGELADPHPERSDPVLGSADTTHSD